MYTEKLCLGKKNPSSSLLNSFVFQPPSSSLSILHSICTWITSILSTHYPAPLQAYRNHCSTSRSTSFSFHIRESIQCLPFGVWFISLGSNNSTLWKRQSFIICSSWMISSHVYIPQLLNIHWWILRLIPCSGYCDRN